MEEANIGIIGGSGFYNFLASTHKAMHSVAGKGEEIWVNTPYGSPSDKILITEYADKKIAFLPRHGKSHQFPPHKINYRANIFALKKLGCSRIIAPTAVGSLKPEIKPGSFVIADQFVDMTKSRVGTFYDGPKVAHISMAEPYCPQMRGLAINACQSEGLDFHKRGVVAVIEGPRFSTRAESNFYAGFADVINMTQAPEATLARELEMCYLNISLVTDYDAGLKGVEGTQPVSAQEVAETFKNNNEKLKNLILEIISNMPDQFPCQCQSALKSAIL